MMTDQMARVRRVIWVFAGRAMVRFLTLLPKCMLCLYRNHKIVMILFIIYNYDCTPCIIVHDCILLLTYIIMIEHINITSKCAPNEDSDRSVQLRGLVGVFDVRYGRFCVLDYHKCTRCRL